MNLSKWVLIVCVAASVSGCATKRYVDESVARLGTRLDEQITRIDQLTQTSQQALERAEAAGVLAEGKFLYTVLLTTDGITFDSDQSVLSDDAQTRLTRLSNDLRRDNKNVYLEIQGHTDSTGPEQYNQQLGLRRAEAVRRHLHAHGVALDRMATISYGEDTPSAPNTTAEGRAVNRRVEVVVLN